MRHRAGQERNHMDNNSVRRIENVDALREALETWETEGGARLANQAQYASDLVLQFRQVRGPIEERKPSGDVQ